MVTKTLVEPYIKAGRALIDELDRAGVCPAAVMWLYEDEEERYRLLIATKAYDDDGPLAAYEVVQNALDKVAEDRRLALSDINVVSPNDRVVQAIRTAVKVGDGEIRLTRNTVNGVFIEDALIYRSR